jgi:hypothetical protein
MKLQSSEGMLYYPEDGGTIYFETFVSTYQCTRRYVQKVASVIIVCPTKLLSTSLLVQSYSATRRRRKQETGNSDPGG